LYLQTPSLTGFHGFKACLTVEEVVRAEI
jgi:hypothetical protein